MATKEQQIEKYTAQLKKVKVPVNTELLTNIVKMVGPANYQLDAMFVATSDKSEMATVLKKFVMKITSHKLSFVRSLPVCKFIQ